MSVKIRLKRIGRKKQPTYRIVVTESRNPRGGKVIDTLGHYTPYLKDKPLEIDYDRLDEWHKKGAIQSDAVTRIIRRARRGDVTAPVTEKVSPEPVPEVKAEAPVQEAKVEEPVPDDQPEEKPVEPEETENAEPSE